MNPGGMPPVGSVNVETNSSMPPPVDMTPLGAPFDEDNPLHFPPMDNSTGTWQRYVPDDITGNLTHEFVPADCTFAHDHGIAGYQQSCQTRWNGGSTMQVRITISGTGYVNQHFLNSSSCEHR